MNTLEIREKLHKYIDSSDDDIVTALFAFFKSYNDVPKEKQEDISEYNQEINEAMSEYAKGNYTTHEDVLKELREL